MQNFFGVEVDVANMTDEELEEARSKIREMLFNLDYQISLRKIAKHHHSSSVNPTEI